MNQVYSHYPAVDSQSLRNIIGSQNEDQLLQLLSALLRRHKQNSLKVEELVSCALSKWENSDQKVSEEAHGQIVLQLLDAQFYRKALIESGNRKNVFLKSKGILEELQNLVLIRERVHEAAGELPILYEQQQIRLPNTIPKQKVIQYSLNISRPSDIDRLINANRITLANMGLKLDTKKSTQSTQTEASGDYPPLKTPKAKKQAEYKIEAMELDTTLQYLPTYETESRLTADIEAFVAEIDSYNRKYKNNFDKLIQEIQSIVSKTFHNSTIDVYGSHATDLNLPHSDIDLVIKLHSSQPAFLPDLLRNLDMALKDCKFIEETKCITQSTTPVLKIKCGKTYNHKRLDISIQETKHNGLQCVSLIKKYLAAYKPLKHLTLILKQFLYTSDLSDTYSGGLSSYGLILMIVSFLQSYPTQWPSLGTLLIDFLNVYGCEVDYAGKTIFPQPPNGDQEITVLFDPENFVYCQQQSLVIIDPMNKTNNVGRPTYNVSKLKLAFNIAFIKLLTFDSEKSPLTHFFNSGRNVQSSLHSVLVDQYKAYSEQVIFGNQRHY